MKLEKIDLIFTMIHSFVTTMRTLAIDIVIFRTLCRAQ